MIPREGAAGPVYSLRMGWSLGDSFGGGEKRKREGSSCLEWVG